MASHSSESSLRASRTPPTRPDKAAKWFYTFCGVVMLAATLVGFKDFYFHGRAYPGRDINPSIRTLVIAHGVSMALWIIVVILQPALIATRKHRLHMAIGRAAAGLAAIMVVMGWLLAVRATRLIPADAMVLGFTPKQFLAIPLWSITYFGVLVGVGIWQRRRREVHRAMMLVATLSALSAALSRIDPLNNLYLGTVLETLWGPYCFSVALGVLLWGVRCVLIKSLDIWLAVGVAILMALAVLNVVVARTPMWESVAAVLLR